MGWIPDKQAKVIIKETKVYFPNSLSLLIFGEKKKKEYTLKTMVGQIVQKDVSFKAIIVKWHLEAYI